MEPYEYDCVVSTHEVIGSRDLSQRTGLGLLKVAYLETIDVAFRGNIYIQTYSTSRAIEYASMAIVSY